MAVSVLERVLKQCRTAMLGRVPLIYIKTDSDLLIRQLVEAERNPLVVQICDKKFGGELYADRPIWECKKEGKKVRQIHIKNYSNHLPTSYGTLHYPHIWTYKMPAEGDISEISRALSQYVMDHEDPSHPTYEILQSSAVILYSSEVHLPASLRPYTEFVEVGYPDEEEIRNIILIETGADLALTENEAELAAFCTDFLGFSVEEITMTLQKIMAITSLHDADRVREIISERKRQKMQGGILEQCKASGEIGGMEQFKAWLNMQVEPLKNSNAYKRKIGTMPPKGVLLCGIPGCGKSEAAKFTAQTLGLPLLKMDIGSLMDKYQGVSEQKMRDALKLAEAMAPCVLWIDELEKGFSGAGSGEESGSFKRMFGYMLGWMQDNQKPCFIFATANNIGGLPKEFFRSGRFDALYAVYLPTAKECVSIFRACMEKNRKNIAEARHVPAKSVELFEPGCDSEELLLRVIRDCLVKEDKSARIVIGSDIQKVVNIALRSLFGEIKISAKKWERALRGAIENASVYGDGEENVDSIAVSYYRMLKKGFTPTGDEVLFDREDLGPGPDKVFAEDYDTAVYRCLRKKIRETAARLDEYERELLIRG